MSRDEGFLSRWSRRKTVARESPQALEEPPLDGERAAAVVPMAPAPQTAAAPAAPADDAPELRLPTMEDVARLTHGSDFSAYVTPGVDASVQRAAMKKLFSDPRYNVMDGLDVYIDDYGKPDPIPSHILRTMHQASVLRLFDEDAPEARPEAHAAPATPATEDPSEGGLDEDPDLQLQPHHAAGRPGPGEGPGA